MTTAAPPLLEVRDLVRHYPVGRSFLGRGGDVVHAVDGVNFTIARGETFGLVGESGCGKTTVARQVLRVERPPEEAIFFEGSDVAALRRGNLKRYRRQVQAVFQDPYASLNPRMRVRDILSEPMSVHGLFKGSARGERMEELLRTVGLNPAMRALYPHQFSGGQRQRIAIARALTVQPQLVVLDEPVSALDVSIRGQILNLLKDLQDQFGVSYLLIGHDLPSVTYMSHKVGVMYLGELVEVAASRRIVGDALHPYTQALLAAAIPPDVEAARQARAIEGEVPSPIQPPPGCRFHTRCPVAMPHCSTEPPVWREVEAGHFVACHLYTGESSAGAAGQSGEPVAGGARP